MSNVTPEFTNFDSAMTKVLSVSHEELKRREEHWKRDHPHAHKKRKPKTSASDHASRAKD